MRETVKELSNLVVETILEHVSGHGNTVGICFNFVGLSIFFDCFESDSEGSWLTLELSHSLLNITLRIFQI